MAPQIASETTRGKCRNVANITLSADTSKPYGHGIANLLEYAPDIGDTVAVGKFLPQFKILDLLGRGGMGVVYKARQLNLDRIVALKILPPVDSQSADFVERFRREARSLAKLSHPNIVAVHDFGENGGLYYFALESVDGVNLREMIRTGKMKPEEALSLSPA